MTPAKILLRSAEIFNWIKKPVIMAPYRLSVHKLRPEWGYNPDHNCADRAAGGKAASTVRSAKFAAIRDIDAKDIIDQIIPWEMA